MARNEFIDITANAASTYYTAKPVYQYDVGIIVRIRGLGLTLPKLQWSNRGLKSSLTTIPQMVDGCIVGTVPEILLMQNKEIHCYLYIENNGLGYTTIEIAIPIVPREKPSDYVFTPGEISSVDGLISVLNDAIGRANEAIEQVEQIEPESIICEPTYLTEGNYTTYFTNANNAQRNKIYLLAKNFTLAQIANLPVEKSGVLMTYGGTSSSKEKSVQIYATNDNEYYWRVYVDGLWREWDQAVTKSFFLDTVGNLGDLTTEVKTNLVSAINEAAHSASFTYQESIPGHVTIHFS